MPSRLRLSTSSISPAATCWSAPTSRPEVSDQFAAHVIWMSEEPLVPGRSYLARIGTKIDADDDHEHQVQDRRQYAANIWQRRRSGSTISHFAICATACAGRLRSVCGEPQDRLLHHHRSIYQPDGRRWHDRIRVAPRHQYPLAADAGRQGGTRGTQAAKPAIVWFTGLSGAGKSTIANMVEQRLHACRAPHDAARRRQRPPRPQPRSRLHRSRSGGKHPPRRRSSKVDDRERA